MYSAMETHLSRFMKSTNHTIDNNTMFTVRFLWLYVVFCICYMLEKLNQILINVIGNLKPQDWMDTFARTTT